MNLREAAEMALEALENVYGKGKRCEAAIKELRQALEQNDLEEAVAKGTKAWADVPDASDWVEQLRGNVDNVYISEERVHKTDKSIHEPVAWMKPSGLVSPYKHGSYQIPLYTAAPKHEWVGLTEDEIWEGLSSFNEYGNFNGFSFAQWIEAKLKEKNYANNT